MGTKKKINPPEEEKEQDMTGQDQKTEETEKESSDRQVPTKGEILKSTREGRGLSLEAVHEATKIPIDVLKAIEEGYTIRTLSEYYYNSFIKMYAKLLKLDVSQFVDQSNRVKMPDPIKSDDDEFNVPELLSDLFSRDRIMQLAAMIGIIIVLFFMFKMIIFFRSQPKTVSIKDKIVQEIKDKEQKIENVIASPTQRTVTPLTVTALKETIAAPSLRNVSLTVRAKRSGWLKVEADGDVVFQTTLRKGTVESWEADQEIVITGKYLEQLEFELNGKLIGNLGRIDRKAKKIIFTEKGLSIAQ